MDSEFQIDLNQPPPIIDHELHNDQREIPISVRSSSSSSSGNYIIELENNDQANSDSSEEEMDNNATPDSNGKTGQDNVQGKKRRVVSDSERWAIYRALLEKSVNGKLRKNTTKEVQAMFNIKNVRTIQRIWKIHKTTPTGADVDVSSRRAGNCGRKRIDVDLSRVKEIELHGGTTLTSFAAALGVSYSKLYRLIKQGVIHRHSSAIKPRL